MTEQTSDPISIRIDEDLAHLSSTISKPHIFRVPARLRLENEQAYEPEIVAIGPYHHGLIHEVFCSSFAEMVPPRVPERNGGNPELEFIKCTTELRDAGIKFKILTESTSLLDIKFENGVLKIPPFIVDDNTESIFRNLIAYEQYLPSIYCRYVTDYMIFMDRLVNSAKDAAKLRKYGIIDNWLGDDEVVSIMFNRIANKICINSTMFCYWKVFKNVNKYCGKHRNIWLAKLRRNYFNSPWSIISFLAAFTLLILTFIQTGFSIVS
ncbi:hypothetical protein F0562_027999 [Nyssa sinensis]|uniref:Uncharacterized protein n=1 Tax=Nyssa sinensis TaxID=561372 RepID=A0A5J5B5D8_9ASTE|nr:hypothetical protein F0562_027999 [Nyssa sinensis]